MSFYKQTSEGLTIENGILLGIGSNTDSHLIIPDGVKEIAPFAFANSDNSFIKVSLNDDLEVIHEGAFKDNTQLRTILFFSNKLKRIDKDAFQGCLITDIELSRNNTWISKDAFDLTKVETLLGNFTLEGEKTIDGVRYDNEEKLLISYSNKKEDRLYRLPPSVVVINSGAFHSAQLKEIVLNDGLKVIGNNAFAYSLIEKMNIPSTIEYIGDFAFKCSRIEEIYFPNSIKEFGEEIFKGDFDFNEHSMIKKVILEGKESEWESRIKPLLDHDDYFAIEYTKEEDPVKYICPVCNEYEFSDQGHYDVCPICGYEINLKEIYGDDYLEFEVLVDTRKKTFLEKRNQNPNYRYIDEVKKDEK